MGEATIRLQYSASQYVRTLIRTYAHMPMHIPTYVSKNVPMYVIIHIDPRRKSEFISSCKYVWCPRLIKIIKACHRAVTKHLGLHNTVRILWNRKVYSFFYVTLWVGLVNHAIHRSGSDCVKLLLKTANRTSSVAHVFLQCWPMNIRLL